MQLAPVDDPQDDIANWWSPQHLTFRCSNLPLQSMIRRSGGLHDSPPRHFRLGAGGLLACRQIWRRARARGLGRPGGGAARGAGARDAAPDAREEPSADAAADAAADARAVARAVATAHAAPVPAGHAAALAADAAAVRLLAGLEGGLARWQGRQVRAAAGPRRAAREHPARPAYRAL